MNAGSEINEDSPEPVTLPPRSEAETASVSSTPATVSSPEMLLLSAAESWAEEASQVSCAPPILLPPPETWGELPRIVLTPPIARTIVPKATLLLVPPAESWLFDRPVVEKQKSEAVKAAPNSEPAKTTAGSTFKWVSKSPFASPEAPVKQAATGGGKSEKTEASAHPKPFAWQPFTFGGVAAFGSASWGRLLIVQLLIAAMVGASIVWFVNRNFTPVIWETIRKLPEGVSIRDGQMMGIPSMLLAERKFLSIAVDLDKTNEVGQSADLQIEFHKTDLSICTMLRSVTGVAEVNYPEEMTLYLGRASAEPWWGAWYPIIYTALFFSVILMLLLIWAVLASIYTVPVRLLAYYSDRNITWKGSWILSSAALLPGAVVMMVGIILYGLESLDMIGLLVFGVGHMFVAWFYVLFAPFHVSKIVDYVQTTNPFDEK